MWLLTQGNPLGCSAAERKIVMAKNMYSHSVLKDLINSEQIIKTGNYQSKLKGNCYRIVRDDKDKQRDAS